MKHLHTFAAACLAAAFLLIAGTASGWSPLSIKEDPRVRMPGTQPPPENAASIEASTRCLNCHGGFNQTVEPAFNWQGSMMAQAARDFLFWSCMTVAGQDSIWAIGNPNAVDICERCHFPKGWVEGRSDPPNASAMTGADFDGVQCDVCHSMFNPHFAMPEDTDWDETNASDTPSEDAAARTLAEDAGWAQSILTFAGTAFFDSNNMPPASYIENAAGQLFLDDARDKRASFADANARHPMLYSRYHKSKYFCSACHDVSNPVLANLGADPSGILPTEQAAAHSYYHVERTFSELMLSAYGQPGGAPGIGPFEPGVFETSRPGNYIAACQDCHMRDTVGKAASQNSAIIRPDNSIEHPNSGQPIHDLTGGNVWVSTVLASAVSGSSNYEPVNAGLLSGPLTLDLSQGQGIDPAALLAGADRARQQLRLAASIDNLDYNPSSGELGFRIQNRSGHKLISGFPEGRRMFINIKAYTGPDLVYEVNPYDDTAGTLKGLEGPAGDSYSYDGSNALLRDGTRTELPDPSPLGANEVYEDSLVYEMHPSSSLTGESKTFHFALADGRWKDNRIPPKGFRIAEAAGRLSQPVHHGVDAPDMYTAAEYAGGYDDVSLTIPGGADRVEVRLYYQTTSREYIEFLRDEINGSATTLSGDGAGGDPAYLVQTDPFFADLKAWGDTIWALWTYNMNLEGAAPLSMAEATFGGAGGCSAPVPTLLFAVPGNGRVDLSWSDETPGYPELLGYKVYYDQAGKSVLVHDTADPAVTTYRDTGLTNGTEYCYKVTGYDAGCESDFGNVLCAIPNAQGQLRAGVEMLETGSLQGKGKNQSFVLSTTFSPGDAVVVRSRVVDADTGLALANAFVDIAISGPGSANLVTAPSDTDGWAEATWQTHAPNKKGAGGTPTGDYTATTTNVTADGYTWDGVRTAIGFRLQ
jgi:hypothetical protein